MSPVQFRETGTGATRKTAMAISAAMVAASCFAAPARAQETQFADFPFVIFCEFEKIQHAYYFSQVGPDGRAIYLTPDRQIGAITVDGVAERLGGDRPGSCSDKTLADLRAAGQAFDLPR